MPCHKPAPPPEHPLRSLFRARGFADGMNWLQERGLVSDNCITAEDVGEVDTVRVLQAANAMWAATLNAEWFYRSRKYHIQRGATAPMPE